MLQSTILKPATKGKASAEEGNAERQELKAFFEKQAQKALQKFLACPRLTGVVTLEDIVLGIIEGFFFFNEG